MGILSKEIESFLEKSSWIRKMFEAGIELKKKFGEENVYDFSLGNPDAPPPKKIKDSLVKIADEVLKPYGLGYMPNSGYPYVRKRLALHISEEQGVEISEKEVILTCGAAGGLNALLKAILDPGDEVISPRPYFVEYRFYVLNHRGKFLSVPTLDNFHLNLSAISEEINQNTKAILINSPHNPTGVVYTKEELLELGKILTNKAKEFGHPIFLISDEPYRFLTYEDSQVPSVFDVYDYSIVVSSFSKSLSLAGERIGYVAISPKIDGKEKLMDGLIFTNRVLGFVNAPAIGQKIIDHLLEEKVDISSYKKKKDLMESILKEAGYEFYPPQGGFYFFPKAPGGDDVAFAKRLQEERILVVPGSGFEGKGYFRISITVPESTILGSKDGFKRAFLKTS